MHYVVTMDPFTVTADSLDAAELLAYHVVQGHLHFHPVPDSPSPEVLMTGEQKEAQRRSFAYGNANIDNPRITRLMVDHEADTPRDTE